MIHTKKPVAVAIHEIEALYIQYNKALQHYVYVHTGSVEEAKDITQEVFLRIWRRREQINMTETLKNYLYAIAKNCIKDYFRNKARTRALQNKCMIRDIWPNDPVLEKELLMVYREAIERLPERQRAVYLLREKSADGRTIAQVLQISKNTVDIHISYSQKKVRDYVGRKMEIIINKKDIKIAA